jgi:hypothetical protein
MKQIATALVVLVIMAGLIVLWPTFEEPEMPSPMGPEDALTESTTYQQTAPLTGVLTGLLIVQPASGPIAGKGMSVILNDLSNLKEGDDIALFVPQEDSVHQGSVTGVSITGSGNRVITGFLDGRYRFVFTVGKFQTFGTIQTQAGRYQLEARDGTGRIVSVKTINEGLDFSQPDYIVPERKVLRHDERAKEAAREPEV